MFRFFKTLREPEPLSSGGDTGPAHTGAAERTGARLQRFEAQALACEKGDRLLFENLNFNLIPGQVLQIKGANGSGKTSLLRMLCGFSQPQIGQLHWFTDEDTPLHRPPPTDIAYLGHTPGIKSALSAEENLHIARRLSGPCHTLSDEQALARVGLSGFEDQQCRHLSAGQRRRVALARLLVIDTVLWILDEPLTSLDTDGIALVEALLSAHLAQGGMAVLSTHQPLQIAGAQRMTLTLDSTRGAHVVSI